MIRRKPPNSSTASSGTKKAVSFNLGSSPTVVVHSSQNAGSQFKPTQKPDNDSKINKPDLSTKESTTKQFGSLQKNSSYSNPSFGKNKFQNKSESHSKFNQQRNYGQSFNPNNSHSSNTKNRSRFTPKSNSSEIPNQNTRPNPRTTDASQDKNSTSSNSNFANEKTSLNESATASHQQPMFGTNKPKTGGNKSSGNISSLFKGNPDIPELAPSDVTPLTEEVFSQQDFYSLGLSNILVSHMDKFGFKSLTRVQQKGIPPILEGKDVLIKSQTGSGKTLTYTLPIVNALCNMSPRVNRSSGVLAVIVVPTRELALQTFNLVQEICKACVFIVPGILIGGEKKKSEKNRIRRGVNILVATPGRLIDHIQTTQCLKLQTVKYFVLDEADRMLEMGYEKSIAGITEALKDAKVFGDDHRHKNANDKSKMEIGNKRKLEDSDDENPG